MSDSFADLWNTTTPLPAKPKPQSLKYRGRDIPTRTSASKSSAITGDLLLLDDDDFMGRIGNQKYGFPQGKDFSDNVDRTGTRHDEDDILGLGDLSKPVTSKVFLFIFFSNWK